MATQNITHTRRQLGRAKVTARAALAAPANEQLAIKAMANDMLDQCAAYEAADANVRAAELRANKEVREALDALEPLKQAYQEARVVIAAKGGSNYPAPSTFATPDDFLHVVEDLEGELTQREAEAWATAMVSRLEPLIESAIKERLEASDAQKALQKAQLAREQAEGALRPVLVRFRRAVRATFGSSAKAHAELRDRRGHDMFEDDSDEPPPTATSGEIATGEPSTTSTGNSA